jgi:hypothetical protein
MTKLTSFQADIRPLFTERDIEGMQKGFNLASYDDVKAHAAATAKRRRSLASISHRPFRKMDGGRVPTVGKVPLINARRPDPFAGACP